MTVTALMPIVRIGQSISDDMTGNIDPLLLRLAEFKLGAVGRSAARNRVIRSYIPLALSAARRYGGRGEPVDDLIQVAVIGLIKAVDRFDAGRGVPFAAYASPTILGEIKRYFRDSARVIRVPRRLQELNAQIGPATENLAHGLLRTPSVAELAADMHVSQRDLLAARRSAGAYRPQSFDQTSPYGEGTPLADSLGDPDPGFDAVLDRESLRIGLAALPPREQRVIALRFFAGMTQTQIAADVGVSQMQISRLLTRSLAHLRVAMVADGVARVG